MREAVAPAPGSSRSRRRRALVVLGLVAGAVLGAHLALAGAYLARNHGFGNVLEGHAGFDEARLEQIGRAGILEFCCEHSATFVDDPASPGRSVLKVELRPDDPDMRGSKRAEFRLKAAPFGRDVWYRARLLVPAGSIPGGEIVTVLQWHAVDDRHLGEAGRAPPLRVVAHEGRWKLASHWDPRVLTGLPFLGGEPHGGVLLWEGPIEPDTWSEWLFQVRWSHDGTGRLKVWKDGEPIAGRDGPNTYNDLLAPFFKAGIYIPQWARGDADARSPRTLLIGEVQESRTPPASTDSAGPR